MRQWDRIAWIFSESLVSLTVTSIAPRPSTEGNDEWSCHAGTTVSPHSFLYYSLRFPPTLFVPVAFALYLVLKETALVGLFVVLALSVSSDRRVTHVRE